MRSALYRGQVMHSRLLPVRHRFRYRVYSLLLDIDELPAIARRLRLLSHNRFNLMSFHDRDHGEGRAGESLRGWAERALAAAGLAVPGGRIELLCFARVLGYGFSPISLWLCHDPQDRLRAVIYEVHNTFGGRHAYAFPAGDGAEGATLAHGCRKAFHVSPFIGMDASYSFRLKPPAETMSLLIRERGPEGEILRATLSGHRQPLTDRGLLAAFLSVPVQGAKIMAGIHWHALRLWLKGVRFHRDPAKRRRAQGAP